jgi:hypothetical protein
MLKLLGVGLSLWASVAIAGERTEWFRPSMMPTTGVFVFVKSTDGGVVWQWVESQSWRSTDGGQTWSNQPYVAGAIEGGPCYIDASDRYCAVQIINIGPTDQLRVIGVDPPGTFRQPILLQNPVATTLGVR